MEAGQHVLITVSVGTRVSGTGLLTHGRGDGLLSVPYTLSP